MIYVYHRGTLKGNFNNNGLGKLTDCIKVEIDHQLNGDYSLYLEYPTISKKSRYLEIFNIIKADGQLFRIYKIEKKQEDNFVIMVWAKHIFYDLAAYFIEDSRAVQCSIKTAMEKTLVDDLAKNYNVDSDILINNTLYMVELNSAEAMFKIIERWGGGELYRDNYNIKILKQIGKETNVLIKYGKNIRGVKITSDSTTVATKIYPKGANGVILTEKYITVPVIDKEKYPPFHIIRKVEFNEAEDEPTLRAMAEEYAKTMGLTSVNIEVDFIELSRAKEYENFKSLQEVNVGDYVIVRHKEFNLDVVVEVIKTKRDLLTGYNSKVELGQPKNLSKDDFSSMLNTVRDELGNKVAQAMTSMLYYANPKELVLSGEIIQPIYLGITAVANTNLSLNFALYCNVSIACTLTIKIELDSMEIPFKPKHKLQQGDNVIGIPIGIPQVSAGSHYIGISLINDTGTITVPIYNLQCMIDGRNLQGGMSSEPPHAEVVHNVEVIHPETTIKSHNATVILDDLIKRTHTGEKIEVNFESYGKIETIVNIELGEV